MLNDKCTAVRAYALPISSCRPVKERANTISSAVATDEVGKQARLTASRHTGSEFRPRLRPNPFPVTG